MVMGGGEEWQWYMYVCAIQYMHAVSKFWTFFDGDGGGGEWQWYMYVCVIQYMHAVSKFWIFFDGDGGWGGRWGVTVVYVCVCHAVHACSE